MPIKTNQELYAQAANGDDSARLFLQAWCLYVHEIDDLIDNQVRDPEKLITALVSACTVFSTAFYVAHAHELEPVVLLATNAYADSLKWEKEPEAWKRQWADVLRFSGNEMVVKVAEICGGYSLARNVSEKLREDSWCNHHNENGGI